MYLARCIIVAVIATVVVGGRVAKVKKCNPETEEPPQPKCGRNEELSDCKIVCPPQSCDSLYVSYLCTPPGPCEVGCNCKNGYLRDKDDICIPSDQCPIGITPHVGSKKCGPNEKFSKCKIVCPPQSCASIYSTYLCDKQPCEAGCDCVDGYLRDTDGTCIPNEQCPPAPTFPAQPICDLNEKPSECKILCPPQTCESIYTTYMCDKRPCEAGCDCVDGYLRNTNGTCIPSEQCPSAPTFPTEPVCGTNEKPSECKILCPPQTCESIYSSYMCDKQPCEAGCDCIDGYLRNSDGICIPNEQCPSAPTIPTEPICGPNEKPSECKIQCPPQTCESIYTTYMCDKRPCEAGCDCVNGNLRNNNGTCIPSEQCPSGSVNPPCNEEPDCQPTCAEPNPTNCPGNKGKCKNGYILSKKGGTCIKIENCEKGCNGDPNAVAKSCPVACPSTCCEPNALPCKKKCEPLGCECAYGYILDKNGKCISPDECPGGNPCNENESFVACKSSCPTDYCPTDDSRATVICETSPFAPCFSGCNCNLNHKRLSREDNRCIVSSECPPVKCTRPNEKWNSCPSECLGEYCDSANSPPVTCNTLVLNCQPRCTCKKNYFRNDSDICIPAKDCKC